MKSIFYSDYSKNETNKGETKNDDLVVTDDAKSKRKSEKNDNLDIELKRPNKETKLELEKGESKKKPAEFEKRESQGIHKFIEIFDEGLENVIICFI